MNKLTPEVNKLLIPPPSDQSDWRLHIFPYSYGLITTADRQWYVGVTANQDGGYQCVRNELSHVSLLLYISTAI